MLLSVWFLPPLIRWGRLKSVDECKPRYSSKKRVRLLGLMFDLEHAGDDKGRY
ncbi:hypothetical protein NEIMUCOT_06522 [Neisseria mucosa ATCC 25996]|uniref:Uncharacterized protein n=1 Tax=Neisseria mucosa (strain ATCC 25996 / DSM 4631 / NCTC 10774 / M26) TaxID=546266 RepID=D3A0T1_NEIM2|nr:hypothetical protein NEIMUCOT_06522 [Neisseria mucosa ATCC 25996]